MSDQVQIDGARVFSVLGYSMLPITALSAVNVFFDLRCVAVAVWACTFCGLQPSLALRAVAFYA
jgi:hypothetical protein